MAVTNAQQRQPLNEVAVQLQKNLLDNLGWPEGDIDATDPGQLQLRLNTVFKTYLRDRRNLIIIDGAPSWDLVEFFICNDMRGALLVTSETDLKPDAQEVGMGMDVDTQWANANVMAVQLAPCTPAREAAEELVRRVVVTPRPLTLVKEVRLQIQWLHFMQVVHAHNLDAGCRFTKANCTTRQHRRCECAAHCGLSSC